MRSSDARETRDRRKLAKDRLSSKKEINARRLRSELQASWDRINHQQGLIRGPRQWARAFLRREGRRPTADDWKLYWTVLREFVDLKRWIRQRMEKAGLHPIAPSSARSIGCTASVGGHAD